MSCDVVESGPGNPVAHLMVRPDPLKSVLSAADLTVELPVKAS
jgi:hypothetical protein